MRSLRVFYCIPAIVLFGWSASFARTGDVHHIVSHNKAKIVTDPAKGYNAFRSWAVFPAKKIHYRKVTLSVTYQCPDSLHCGEWDYVDNIFLRRAGGSSHPARDIELARLISPYGWRFGPTWKFTWHVDVTDFAFLLHDSVEVEFKHAGYESNKDRGWLVTLDFALTEGKPAMKHLGMDTLWQGTFPYGDSSNSIEKYLVPRNILAPEKARVARVRLLQTGHGMDDSENCAEFCNKWRRLLFDGKVVDQRQVWRRCGTNPLYPQGGTWIYDRANWCPGSMVSPDVIDLPIDGGSSHVLDADMQPYVNRKHPSASYLFSSYVFYYSIPWALNDASVEEILAPSTTDEHSRTNPICENPRIVIKNNGRRVLRTVTILHGIKGERPQSFKWRGALQPQQTAEVTLPGILSATSGDAEFRVTLEKPNDSWDEYPPDNTLSSTVTIPPRYGTAMILALRTNNDSSSTSYRLFDQSGAVAGERALGSLRANTVYHDTLFLRPGCYQLVVRDTAGDGLEFWANPEGGYGYVRLLDLRGRLLKSFPSDFGSEISHSFVVTEGPASPVQPGEVPIVNPFPPRNGGTFAVDVFLNFREDISFSVVTEDSSRTVFSKDFPGVKELMVPVDISKEPEGYYFVRVKTPEGTTARRIRVKRQ